MSKYLTFYLFADDTNIYFESPELSKIEKVVNRELRKVRKWLEANRLALNVDKTNFVIFHSQQRKLTDHIVLNIHGSQRCLGPSSHSKAKHKFKKVDD